jgi:hypothetical protein
MFWLFSLALSLLIGKIYAVMRGEMYVVMPDNV